MSREKIYEVSVKVSVDVRVVASSIEKAKEWAEGKARERLKDIPDARVMGAWSDVRILDDAGDDE